MNKYWLNIDSIIIDEYQIQMEIYISASILTCNCYIDKSMNLLWQFNVSVVQENNWIHSYNVTAILVKMLWAFQTDYTLLCQLIAVTLVGYVWIFTMNVTFMWHVILFFSSLFCYLTNCDFQKSKGYWESKKKSFSQKAKTLDNDWNCYFECVCIMMLKLRHT